MFVTRSKREPDNALVHHLGSDFVVLTTFDNTCQHHYFSRNPLSYSYLHLSFQKTPLTFSHDIQQPLCCERIWHHELPNVLQGTFCVVEICISIVSLLFLFGKVVLVFLDLPVVIHKDAQIYDMSYQTLPLFPTIVDQLHLLL